MPIEAPHPSFAAGSTTLDMPAQDPVPQNNEQNVLQRLLSVPASESAISSHGRGALSFNSTNQAFGMADMGADAFIDTNQAFDMTVMGTGAFVDTNQAFGMTNMGAGAFVDTNQAFDIAAMACVSNQTAYMSGSGANVAGAQM
ncbi:hypothetical protein MauCBS54593_005307 [Microsporum audouinii]